MDIAEYMMMSITCYEVRMVYLWFVSAQIHEADVSKYSVLFFLSFIVLPVLLQICGSALTLSLPVTGWEWKEF